MIYLDYAANTPTSRRVLECFMNETIEYEANPNSDHVKGRLAKKRMEEITKDIAGYFHVKPSEIIYTSGASESNNLAIKGISSIYKNKGKHMISTCLEHSSVSGAFTVLQNQGYEIDLVDILPSGQVDLEHLEELLREDTILVSICYVDSELGVEQPIQEIAKLLKKYPSCHFHVDATQAIGKIEVNFEDIDCVSFTPHKFYGINGSGILINKESTVLEPLIHGGSSTTIYRSGTPSIAMAAALKEAILLVNDNRKEQSEQVLSLNKQLKNSLMKYPLVRINSTNYSVPHILNISVKGVKGVKFQEALSEKGICVSVKSACSVTNTPSRPVYAVTKDKKNALCSWRISLSYLTTKTEIEEFLVAFDECYKNLTK